MNDIIYIAGMIPLVPGSMKLLDAGILQQCKLALRHVHRVIKAMDSNTHIRDVVMVRLFNVVLFATSFYGLEFPKTLKNLVNKKQVIFMDIRQYLHHSEL